MVHLQPYNVQTPCIGVVLEQIYYRPMKSYQVNDPAYDSSEQTVATNRTQVTLTGLYAASTYTIYVRAVNEAGTESKGVSVTAQIAAKGEHRDLHMIY